MKTSTLTFLVAGCLAGLVLAGCGKTSEQKVEGAKEELKDAKANYQAEWQTFKAESEKQIKTNEEKIEEFKAKMDKAGTKAKAKYKKAVADLEKKNHELKEKLEDYKDEGQGRWEEFKTNFKNDLDSVGKTIGDLFKDKD